MARKVSRETRDRQSRAQRSNGLTLKQERFVKQYARLGNGTKAAKLAGYSDSSADVLGVQAHQNLSKPKIAAAVEREIAVVARDIDFSTGRVRSRLDQLSHAAEGEGQYAVAVRAEELLGKAAGLFVDQSITLTGSLSRDHLDALVEVARQRQAEAPNLGQAMGRGRLLNE